MVSEKIIAPDFKLPNQDGEMVSLGDFKGKLLILYFYPKDNTPGCTTEACNFRDDYALYNELGVEIIGISPDGASSHLKFQSKHNLPFTLLADEDHKVSEDFGVWVKKKNFGKEYYGIKRTTFLIGKDGEIIRVFKNVKPSSHSDEVIIAIKELI